MPKISIIGVGRVGSMLAHLCVQEELGNLVLIDQPASMAQGVALDLKHAAVAEGRNTSIIGTGDYSEIQGSDIVCITAGARRTSGASRDEVLLKNAEIVKNITVKVAKHASQSKILVITNPLDAMTYVAQKTTDFPRERIIGMAGILDTVRFRSLVAEKLNLSSAAIATIMVGGHGDRTIPVMDRTTVNGKPITQVLSAEKIKTLLHKTHTAGDTILKLEGGNSAYHAPAASVLPVIRAIVKDTHETFPCSVYLKGEYGLEGICIGVPVRLGKNGMEKIVEMQLTPEEKRSFLLSAKAIRDSIQKLNHSVLSFP